MQTGNHQILTLDGTSPCGAAAARSVTLTDCVISNNRATFGGGIAFDYNTAGSGCNATRCVIIGNTTVWQGGGADECYLTNCLIVKNKSGTYGSGAYGGYLVNCTVVSNESLGGYAGIDGSTLVNCIVWGNYKSGGVISNYQGAAMFAFSCTTPLPAGAADGGGNTSADPQFADFAGGNYRLGSGSSPCLNAGTNQEWMTGAFDLDGKIRVRYGTVDMGCYERINSGTIYSFH